MPTNEPSISVPLSDVKWVRAILTFSSIKGFLKLYAGLLILLVVAFMLTIIGAAIQEVSSILSDLWMHGDSIVRCVLIVIVVYAMRKTIPYLVTLHTKGVL